MDINENIRYKASKFNYYLHRDNIFLIYNTLNKKLYCVSESIWDYLTNLENQPELNTIAHNVFQDIYKENLIFEYEYDEKAIMDYTINSIIYENKLNITIVPTEACNFRCVYCYEAHNIHNMTDIVEKSINKFFRKYVNQYQSVAIDWFGGEPLLQKERVIRIMNEVNAICKASGVPICSSMITNGYLLDVNTFDELVNNKVLYYQVTLDSIKSVHDERRPLADGSPTFDTIFQNLINIKKYSKHKHFRIIIRSNVGKSDAIAYHEFLKQIIPIVENDRRFVVSCEAIQDWGGTSIRNLKTEIARTEDDVLVSSINKIVEKNINMYLDDFSNMSIGRCQAGKMNGFLINYDGIIHACSMSSCGSTENKENGEIGSLKSNGNLYIDKTKKSRLLVVSNQYKECECCPWLPCCLLANCPLSCAKGEKLRCIKQFRGVEYLENIIWNMYNNKTYITLIDEGNKNEQKQM